MLCGKTLMIKAIMKNRSERKLKLRLVPVGLPPRGKNATEPALRRRCENF